MTAVERLLDALPRFGLVLGKGGVGKTTCAAALALRAAGRGEHTLLLSTDPAATLGDALGVPLAAEAVPVPGAPGLEACQLDAAALRASFFERWRETILTIVDRGTYLDRDDITGLVDTAMPGADEIFAVLRLAELERGTGYARIIVDTAPTGHTLRLLALPRTFEALVALLDSMQEKHRFMVRALTHRYRQDAADAFIVEMRDIVHGFREALADASRTGAVLVGRAEPVVVAETERYAAKLHALGVSVVGVIENAAPDRAVGGDGAAGTRYIAPKLEEPPLGIEGLARWGASLRSGSTPAAEPGSARGGPPPNDTIPPAERRSGIAPTPTTSNSRDLERPSRAGVRAAPPTPPLTIVGGKGGVGKTLVSCALAIASADAGADTLLVSTDPAPSVADVLGIAVGDRETGIDDVPKLVARQMDASAAFDRLRERYQERVDAVFDGLVARGINAAHDRAVLRELLALAPPGIDEVYALAELGETLAEGRFARVIVDPAPTGHLLRLLEMPALALDWSHRLMRMMLKYRDVASLGEAAEDVLAFARRTRALQALAGDSARAGVVIVTLDEPLVRGETVRLARAVATRGLGITGVVWNRTERPSAALPLPDTVGQFVAPATTPAPIGVSALRHWITTWRALTSADVEVHG